ncbi:MAG TPA: DUF6504 family protein [Burkholderiales bacterium]|nr:DUF6504 family protein [Burkholderiales bacterium]
MREQFVGEAIKPVVSTCDTSRMAVGEPGLPREFLWRGRTIKVAAALRTWRETGKCRNGSPELYVRKHWFEVVATSGGTMKLYFERQPRRGQKGARWWLFSILESEETDPVLDARRTRRAPEPAP